MKNRISAIDPPARWQTRIQSDDPTDVLTDQSDFSFNAPQQEYSSIKAQIKY